MNLKQYIQDMEELMQGRPSLILDFSNPVHADFFVKYHGGRDFLKTKFPNIYEDFLSLCAKSLRGEAQEELSSYNGMVTLSVTPSAQNRQDRSDGKSASVMLCNVQSAAVANAEVGEICQVLMSGMVVNKRTGDFLFSIGEKFNEEEICKQNGTCTSEDEDDFYLTEDTRIYSSCEFSFYDRNGRMIGYMLGQEAFDAKRVDPVESFTINDPTIKYPDHVAVKINYLARGGDFDYQYIVSPDPVTKQVKIMLPLSGSILLKPGFKAEKYAVDTPSTGMRLTYDGKSTATNGLTQEEISACFHPKEVTTEKNGEKIKQWQIDFEFPVEWTGSFYRFDKFPYGVTASLNFAFFYTITGPFDLDSTKTTTDDIGMSILSNESATEFNHSAKKTVYIRKIVYLWGCFGKNTNIRVADGSMKPVAEIRPGDMVVCNENTPEAVQNIMVGREEILFHIETENGHHIAVTENHPILTKRGAVYACKITPADEMIMEDGTASPVRYVYPEEYNDSVYSIVLENARYIYANGFTAGDYKTQNSQAQPDITPISPKAKLLLEEYAALYHEMKESII